MKYQVCVWIHDYDIEPILIVDEIDHDGYETRKIELFRNGEIGWADTDNEVHGTGLGEKPVPEISVINSDPQFRAWYVDKESFERYWSIRKNTNLA